MLIVSVLSIFELEYSRANAPQEKQEKIQNTIQSTMQSFDVIPVTCDLASEFGNLKQKLKEKKNLGRKKNEASQHRPYDCKHCYRGKSSNN